MRGGQVGASLKKLYAYGIRNSFGMAFDPFSGDLWEQENGDDSFSEINRVKPGFNSGWVQVMGPLEPCRAVPGDREQRGPTGDPAAASYYGLQQVRWGPENIATTPREASERLFRLPGSRFSDPELAWKYEFAPGGIDFLSQRELGRRVPGRPVRRLRERPRQQHLPAPDRPQPQGDRPGRQAPARPRCRQHPQVRPDRERVAAVRHGLRRHTRRAREPRRHALRRVGLAGHDLRDPQQVGIPRGRRQSPVAGRALCS